MIILFLEFFNKFSDLFKNFHLGGCPKNNIYQITQLRCIGVRGGKGGGGVGVGGRGGRGSALARARANLAALT